MHVDLWTNDPSAFRIKLVDFGGNGVFGGGDDTEHEITLDESSMPPIQAGAWNVLDIPLADFAGLLNKGHLAQLIISGASPTVYLDNIFFFTTEPPGPTEPSEPARTPAYPAANVVSLYSDAYDDAHVDAWSAGWDQANVEDVEIAGTGMKKYTGLVFAGIEFTSQTVDASGATHFHMDIWTPDGTDAPAAFRVKLVDFGALYSDAYTDVTVDTWSADWDQADLEDVEVQGDGVKKCTNLVFAGIEFASATIDASEMTHFHFDFWTPDATADPAAFRVKLVDFGADGAFGGGDDSEHELTLTAASDPALATGMWVSYDVPFSELSGLTG